MPRKPNYDRDDLITRARDVFWRQGWAGTSMKDLEKTLLLKPGSFYAAFGSKDALYGLALERYAKESRETLRTLAVEHGAHEALKRFPLHIIEDQSGAAKACMLAKTVLELQPQDHALAEQATEALNKALAGFVALFKQAQKDGKIALCHAPDRLALRYQSDLMGLRVSAERADIDARAIASDMAADLDHLT